MMAEREGLEECWRLCLCVKVRGVRLKNRLGCRG